MPWAMLLQYGLPALLSAFSGLRSPGELYEQNFRTVAGTLTPLRLEMQKLASLRGAGMAQGLAASIGSIGGGAAGTTRAARDIGNTLPLAMRGRADLDWAQMVSQQAGGLTQQGQGPQNFLGNLGLALGMAMLQGQNPFEALMGKGKAGSKKASGPTNLGGTRYGE